MTKKNLNPEQIEAIRHKKGPLLIIAGAGTGKTTVITERVNFLISENLAKPSEILGLTFTEKAAREMEIRVDEVLPYGYTQMWIMTFHGFCDRILRSDALHIGLDPKYKLTTAAEATQLIRQNLFNFDLDYFRPLGNPNKFIAGILQHFSRLADEDVSPVQYLDWIKTKIKSNKLKNSPEEKLENKKWLELASAYHIYEELKVKHSFLDFGDLITKTLLLLRNRPNILKHYSEQFKYILVDEYQDTNFAQNELVKILAGVNGNITVVADDDQAIYRWRGAAISNVIQFRNNFPETKIITLTKNYRSSQTILDRAYGLIQNNNPDRLEVVENINKKLISQIDKNGEHVEFTHIDRVENEADWVAKKIVELTNNEDSKYNFGDIAILVRANNHADPFVRALLQQGVPHQFLGPGKLFKQNEIVELVSYLRVLYDTQDSVSMFKLLTMQYLDISSRDVAAVTSHARRKNMNLFSVCENIEKLEVSEDGTEKIKNLVSVISKNLNLSRRESAGQLLFNFLEEMELLPKILNPDTSLAQKKAANISKFFDKLKSYEVDHEDSTVAAVVDWLELSTELGESPLAADVDWTTQNAVSILTVHSAKGLEFPVVFLVNLVGERFPSRERAEQIPIPDDLVKEVLPQGDHHLQEERRLFYVGMTRAKEKLFLTAADYYGEGKREKKLSPFIFEALGDEAVGNEMAKTAGEQMSLLSFQNQHFQATADYIKPFHIDYLSVSQIETFEICPLHYKLRYVYSLPTPPSASASFGTSIHAALKAFYEKVSLGEKPNEKTILECLDENWTDEGFSDKTHEKKFYEKGKIYLQGFLRNGFNKKTKILALEQPFSTNLFALSETKKGTRALKIGGKIDRIDDLGGGVIEIIDYKTSARIPSQKDVDRDLQLSFYALAATQIPEFPFGKIPDKVKLSLYFLDNQEKITTTRSFGDLQKEKEKILKIREEIEASDFRCSSNPICKFCEFKLLCNSEEF